MTERLDALQRRLAGDAAPLAKTLARVFARSWPRIPESDFLSVGNEALVRAAIRFDSTHGVAFEAFAYRPVWGAMMDLAHRESFTVQKVARRMAALAIDAPVEVSIDDWLAESSKTPREEARDALRGRAASLLAVALAGAEEPTSSPEDEIIAHEERLRTRTALDRALAELPDRERTCLRSLYDDARTLDATAASLGVAKRTVQRVHERVKQRLAAALSNLEE